MTREKITDLAVAAGMTVIVVMAVLPLLDINEMWMRWAFAAAAAVVLVARFIQRYDGDNIRIQRLYRMNIVAALMFAGSAAMTFYNPGTNDWLALLLAGAVLQIYAAFAIDHEQAKNNNDNNNKQNQV